MALAIVAMGLKGEVILPSFSFISTAHLPSLHGLVPVFCDIAPASWNHLWGRACHIRALQELANKRDIKLLFDAAHAFGSEYQGKKIGNFGDAEVFSFHATKVFHTSEGGAITTNDPVLAQRLKKMDTVCDLLRFIIVNAADITTALGNKCYLMEQGLI